VELKRLEWCAKPSPATAALPAEAIDAGGALDALGDLGNARSQGEVGVCHGEC